MRLLHLAVVSVALMEVTVLATMMPVVQVTAARDRKMSRLLFVWLFLLLELVKDAGCFIGSLRLLRKGSMGTSFFFCKLKLMCLRLGKKDLFAFLLCCGQLLSLMEFTVVEVAEELHLTLHKLMHWH
jgi:hypothetical protein